MNRNTFYLLFLTLIFLGLAGYYLVQQGWYPLAIVNGDWIWARDFQREYAAVVNYYRQILPKFDKNSLTELKRASLDALVADSLIYDELTKRLDSNLSAEIENKISAALGGGNDLPSAVKALYQLDFAEFKELILRPQAQREILAAHLASENKKLEDWLNDERKNASVVLLSTSFGWNGQEVITREVKVR